MNFTRTPLQFTPAYNPVIFNLTASTNPLLYKLNVLEEVTQSALFTGNMTSIVDEASTNLSRTLSSFVRSDVDNTTDVVIGKPRNIIGYQLNVVDYGLNTGGTLDSLSTGFTSDTFYAYEANLDILQFAANLTDNTYVVRPDNQALFMTLQPDFKVVNDFSFEQLYILNNGDLDQINLVATPYGGNDVTPFTYPYTGITSELISPAVPEVRALAQVTITSTASIGDNIGVYVSTGSTPFLLGSYTVTVPMLPSAIAAGLASSMVINPYGFGISFYPNQTVLIYAPVGYGASGNSIGISGSVVTSATTYTGASLSTVSFTGLNAYSGLTFTGIHTLRMQDPTYGFIEIGGFIETGTTNITGVVNQIVAGVNSNVFGYSASATSPYSFTVYARPNAPNLNGVNCIFNTPNFTITKPFISGGTGTTFVIHHDVVPNTVIPFTGGAGAIPPISAVTQEKMLRFQVSPKMLSGFTPTSDYTIELQDVSGNSLTELRHYVYDKDVNCSVDLINIVFTNSIGGVDSIQMVNPQQTISNSRLTIRTDNINPYNSQSVYQSGNDIQTIFNPDEQTYAVTPSAKFKCYTQILSDEEVGWLIELVNSKSIWIELSGGALIPLQLVNTNYNVLMQKYQKEPIQIQFEFSLPSNMLPALIGNILRINN